MARGRAAAGDRLGSAPGRVSPEHRGSRRAALRAELTGVAGRPGRRAAVVHDAVRPRQPDHQLSGAAVPAVARGDDAAGCSPSARATRFDDFRDAEPGKILHEIRHGERTLFGDAPFSPYYGSVDSTPLFLVVLDEYERWTGDRALVSELEPAARAALDLDREPRGHERRRVRRLPGAQHRVGTGQPVLEGLVELDRLRRRSPGAFRRSRPARSRATSTTRSCAARGWLRRSGETPAGRSACGRRQPTLRTAFHDRFLAGRRRSRRPRCWTAPATAVDVEHVEPGPSAVVGNARRGRLPRPLRATCSRPPLYSGWGVRTMAADEAAYNPLEYHNGTIWPHDNSIIAAGLARYGYRDDANTIAVALVRAAVGVRRPAAGGVRRISGRPDRSAGRVPDLVQPAGLGGRRDAPSAAVDARARGGGRRAGQRSGAAAGDRPSRPARHRGTMGQRATWPPRAIRRSRATAARSSARPMPWRGCQGSAGSAGCPRRPSGWRAVAALGRRPRSPAR